MCYLLTDGGDAEGAVVVGIGWQYWELDVDVWLLDYALYFELKHIDTGAWAGQQFDLVHTALSLPKLPEYTHQLYAIRVTYF